MSNEEKGYFNTRLSPEPKRDAIWKEITRHLQRFIPENARILELGAGYCSFINQIKASRKHALDRSGVIRRYAHKDVTLHITNCTNLRIFEDNSFDVVFSSFLYEHLNRQELNIVMRELRRILRTDGILMTMLPNFKYIARHYFDDYTHKQIFSHISFADYLESRGFEVTHVQGKFIPYSFKSRLPKSALLMRLYLWMPWSPFAGNMLVVARNREYNPRRDNTRGKSSERKPGDSPRRHNRSRRAPRQEKSTTKENPAG